MCVCVYAFCVYACVWAHARALETTAERATEKWGGAERAEEEDETRTTHQEGVEGGDEPVGVHRPSRADADVVLQLPALCSRGGGQEMGKMSRSHDSPQVPPSTARHPARKGPVRVTGRDGVQVT